MLVSILIIMTGLMIGSFLNSCAFRIPRKISLLKLRSFCPACRSTIIWWQNLPVLSFLILRGRCHVCGSRIPLDYPLLEISTAIIYYYLFLKFGLSPDFLLYTIFLSALLVISVIDSYHKIIPNSLIVFLVASFITLNTLFQTHLWSDVIFNAGIPMTCMIILKYFTDKLFNKESLGMGDVKLCGAVGLFLGRELFFQTLFMASAMALLIVTLYNYKKENFDQKYIPLAPYLTMASFLTICWPFTILNLVEYVAK
ncbi:MAG: prepilin peptidase [Calditrichaeota bacterium]|nr:prepilin peptidase [Calditrichota bacterium]